MSEKHIVVQGGTCICKFSEAPQTDKIKVLTQTKKFANEKDGTKNSLPQTKKLDKRLKKILLENAPCNPLVLGICPAK